MTGNTYLTERFHPKCEGVERNGSNKTIKPDVKEHKHYGTVEIMKTEIFLFLDAEASSNWVRSEPHGLGDLYSMVKNLQNEPNAFNIITHWGEQDPIGKGVMGTNGWLRL